MTDTVLSDCLARGHGRLAGVWSDLSQDVVRYLNKSPANIAQGDTFKSRLSAFLTPDLLCLLLYRTSHYFYVKKWYRLADAISFLNSMVHRVTITPQSCIAAGCRLPHPSGVTFHGRAGSGLTLYSLAVCCPREPVLDIPVAMGPNLGERVTVGAHAVVMGPINLGDDSKVAFTVWIDHDVPPGGLVVSAVLRPKMRPGVPETRNSTCLQAAFDCAVTDKSVKFDRNQE
jgi:serine O-acetyltransferase